MTVSDSAQLKNLAFVSVSKPKKSKSKKNKTLSHSRADETLIAIGEDPKDVVESHCSLETTTTTTPSMLHTQKV